jgi:hypothetical protein
MHSGDCVLRDYSKKKHWIIPVTTDRKPLTVLPASS